ncbi:MAG: hypothetical protein HUJ97_08075 [Bacteroidales bacterium]|nr:hypothetical protein [Bacteroidales bacterium]
MKKILLALLAVIAFSACQQQKPQPSVKAYAWCGWDQDKTSEEALKNMFQDWKGHGIIGVCMNCGFDMDKTARCAAIAHEVGLEYHAWAPSMIQGGQDSTWYTVNRFGKSAFTPENRAYVEYYQTLDPHNPEVVQFMVDKYCQLAAIPYVDYVQFDYIRYADVVLSEGLWEKYQGTIDHQWRDAEGNIKEYPGADYCYCDACCEDFKAKTGIDIKAKLAEGVDPATITEWAQFRCDNVTNLVNAVCKAVHDKGYKLSADVFPGPKSYAEWMVRQQWNNWDVDVFFPMNYNDFYLKTASWVGEVTKEEVESTSKPVISGLFICHDWENKASLLDPENSGLIPSEIAEAVSGAVKAGAAGVCLFTPESMTDAHWAEFEKAIK